MTSIVLNFDRDLPCSFFDCQQLTRQGQLDGYVLQPACPVHGLAFESDEASQFASVERYITHLFDNEGQAKTLGTVDLATVPGYTPFEDARSIDLAWAVDWSCQDKRKRLYAVWLVDQLMFEVYQGL